MTLQSESVKQYWESRQAVYNDNFRRLVRELMLHNPESVPMNIAEAMSKVDG